MRILLAGASGTLGRALTRHLNIAGHTTLSLVRSRTHSPTEIHWDPYATLPLHGPSPVDVAPLENFDAAICLSGEDISAKRWTRARRAQIIDSRIQPIAALGRIFATLRRPPTVFITASGANYYGSPQTHIDAPFTEDSPSGNGFLSEVCRQWESAALSLASSTLRVTPIRFGVILSKDGGMVHKILPIFRWGLGGPIASGRQRISWVSITDACRIVEFTLTHTYRDASLNSTLPGPVNAVAPSPITNAEFTQALANAIHRPAFLPVPSFALRFAFGSMANELLLADLPVLPKRLNTAGFRHIHTTIESALADLIR